MAITKKQWDQLYSEFCKSNVSIAEFANKRKLNLSSAYSAFQRRKRAESNDEISFVPIKAEAKESKEIASAPSLELLMNGITIKVHKDFDKSLLAETLRVVKETCLD